MSKELSLSEVVALPVDSWVPLNSTVLAHVNKVEPVNKKAGGQFWKASLSDDGGEILATMSLFNAPKFSSGDVIRLGGKGIKRGDYNGKAQLSTGKETTIEVSSGKAKIAAAVHGAQAEHANQSMIAGATVGLSIKSALELHSQGMGHEQMKSALASSAWWEGIYHTASDIVRISRLLEAGKLADPVRSRGGGHSSSRQSSVVEELGAEEEPTF